MKRYQRGIGGNYGRFTRRGDVIAGLWFLQWQIGTIFKSLALALWHRQRPSGLGWVVDRFIGFWRGFRLSPKEGFVNGAELTRLHQTLLPASPNSMPITTGNTTYQKDKMLKALLLKMIYKQG